VDTIDIAPDGKMAWLRGALEYDEVKPFGQRIVALNLDTGETKLLAGYPRPMRFTPQATTAVAPDYSRLAYLVAERKPEAAAKVKERQPLTPQDYMFDLRMVDAQSGTLLWRWQNAPLQDAVALALGPLKDGQTTCVVLRAEIAAGEEDAKYGLTAYHIKSDPLSANLPLSAAPDGPAKVWQVSELPWPVAAPGLILNFSPDGRWLATSGGVREANTGQLRYALPASQVVIWSPDSRKIAVSDGGHTQWLDGPGGKAQAVTPAVGRLLSISADGSALATASSENTSLIWMMKPHTGAEK
jgi:hypothetical protein